jgi:anti-sigma B factor antagonist
VIVDASRVAFLDSTGLGVFVNLLKMMAPSGVLAIAGAQAPVTRLLSITQLDRVFKLFDDVPQAEAMLGG